MADLSDEDQIWRISSLTAYVDDETKILLLPVPESKRKTKIMNTLYNLQSIKDLLNLKGGIEKVLTSEVEEEEIKRFEDLTQEEILDDIHKKRQHQMKHMLKVRKYQFIGLTMCGIFYFMVYRNFLHPKSIINSVVYNNAVKHIKMSGDVKKTLGSDIHMMNCNGKIYPVLSNCKFDITVFGN